MRLLSLILCLGVCGCLPPTGVEVDAPVETGLPAPNPSVQESVRGITEALTGAREDAIEVAGLYQALADVLEDDGESEAPVVSTTGEVREGYVRAGKLCFQYRLKGKYPTLSGDIDSHVKRAIGTLDVPLTPDLRAKLVSALRDIAWAAWSAE